MPLTCMIVGDCIATRPHGLGGRFSQCEVSAAVGLSSSAIVKRVPASPMKWLVISAGSNDPTNPRLEANLEAMRGRAKADQVVWVAPVHPKAFEAVRKVAAKHGDRFVSFTPGRDNVHPKSYKSLASSVSAVIKE